MPTVYHHAMAYLMKLPWANLTWNSVFLQAEWGPSASTSSQSHPRLLDSQTWTVRRVMERKAPVPILTATAVMVPSRSFPGHPGVCNCSPRVPLHAQSVAFCVVHLLTTSFWRLGAIPNTLDFPGWSVNGKQRALGPAVTWGLSRSIALGGFSLQVELKAGPFAGHFPVQKVGVQCCRPSSPRTSYGRGFTLSLI